MAFELSKAGAFLEFLAFWFAFRTFRKLFLPQGLGGFLQSFCWTGGDSPCIKIARGSAQGVLTVRIDQGNELTDT